MYFNWIQSPEASVDFHQARQEMEYAIRPKIVRILLATFEDECCVDFSCFYFDVDLDLRVVRIAKDTPEAYRKKIKKAFKAEFGKIPVAF